MLLQPNTKLPVGVKAKILYDGPKNEKWLEIRRLKGVGASESPAVLGMIPRWGSPYTVYAEKLGIDPAGESNEQMEWGLRLEPLVLDAFQIDSHREVAGENRTFQSTKTRCVLASPDGWQLANHRPDPGTVQVKTTGYGDWEKDGVPEAVNCQMQQEFYVTGLQWGTAVVLMHGNKMRWADVERDDDFIDGALVPTLKRFWRYVRRSDPLPRDFIDGSDATRKILERLYPETASEEIARLDGEMQIVHNELLDLDAKKKAIEMLVKKRRNLLREAIGKKTFGVLPDGTMYSLTTVDLAKYNTTYRRLLHHKKGVSE